MSEHDTPPNRIAEAITSEEEAARIRERLKIWHGILETEERSPAIVDLIAEDENRIAQWEADNAE